MSYVNPKALSNLPSQELLEGGLDSASPFTSNTVASFLADTNLLLGYQRGERPSLSRVTVETYLLPSLNRRIAIPSTTGNYGDESSL